MATADLSSISSALAQLYQDSLYPQMNRAVVLARLLPYQPGTGKNLAWDAETGTAARGEILGDGANASTFNNDTVTPAILDWGRYSESFSVTGLAMAAAGAAGNPAELAALFLEKMERAVRGLCKYLNDEIYVGVTSGGIVGLTGTAGGLRAAGTYAGIDRSSVTQWAGNELTNGGVNRSLSFDLMRDTRRTIYNACGEMPDLIVCDAETFEAYGKLFKEQRRYLDNIRTAAGKITLDGGYKALEFDGIPIVADVSCPANRMLFLNTKYVKLRQLPSPATEANRSPGIIQLHGTAEEQFGEGNTGLTARVNPLAVNGDKFSVQLICYPQVQVLRPNSCAILGDLTP